MNRDLKMAVWVVLATIVILHVAWILTNFAE